MCAKKTPTTPTKQNTLTGVLMKSPVKKVAAQKQTTKNKVDESIVKAVLTSAIVKDLKPNSDAKKPEIKLTATSNKKVNKTISSETKASNPTTPIKGNIKQTQIAAKKITNSRDSSTDNAKGKKQPINGKTNKAKAVDSDRDKSGENKSNQIRDNKITVVKSDEEKSNCNLSNEECNKCEISSSSLSLKSSGESDNVIKEKLCKKGSDKPKLNASSTSIPKKINNRNNDEGSKKSADKSKPSKIMQKMNKEENSKIKISNELKNLGIEMSKSNSSLAVVIQEGLSSGVKTSICEMVKTKARFCSNLNSGVKNQSVQAKKISEVKALANKTNKASQEKELKDDEAKVNESVEGKKTNSEQFKLIEMPISDDKKIIVQDPSKSITTNEPLVIKSKNKISALVNAKNSNKNKLSMELKQFENVNINKANDLELAKPVKRKYVKKKKPEEDAANCSKNNVSASESDARSYNDKIDQNKSNCTNISDDGANNEIKSASKADTSLKSVGEIFPGGKTENSPASESTAKSTQNKPKLVPKAKTSLQEGSKSKKTVSSLTVDGTIEGVATVAEKIKRKYVKKFKPMPSETADKSKEKFDIEKSQPTQTESDKLANDLKKEVHKNGQIEKKPKTVSDEPTKDSVENNLVESQEKTAKNKSLKSKVVDKKPIEKVSKLSLKKQKIEIKQEDKSIENSSSESENSTNSSDSDSELTEDTFKKPNKQSIQRNLRNKKYKQIACKRTRVASLNAIAKVHCLYENEARSVYEANILKAIKQSCAVEESTDDEEEAEDERKKVDLASMR